MEMILLMVMTDFNNNDVKVDVNVFVVDDDVDVYNDDDIFDNIFVVDGGDDVDNYDVIGDNIFVVDGGDVNDDNDDVIVDDVFVVDDDEVDVYNDEVIVDNIFVDGGDVDVCPSFRLGGISGKATRARKLCESRADIQIKVPIIGMVS